MAYNQVSKIWFYLKPSGRSPVEEFLAECSQEIKTSFVEAVSLLELGNSLQMPLSRNLSSIYSGLHELRLKDRHGQVRFFYYIKKGGSIFFLHGSKKKTQEIPKSEIEIALKRIKEV